MEDAHAKTAEEVLNHFQTDPEKGLTPDQVKRYQAKYGPNGKQLSLSKYPQVSTNKNLNYLIRN